MKLILFSLFLITGCSTLSPLCDPLAAHTKGYESALQGTGLDEALPQGCSAQEAFRRGWEQGIAVYCESRALELEARRRGKAGEPMAFDPLRYKSCANLAGLEESVQRGYREGLDAFCADGTAFRAGQQDGEANRKAAFPETLGSCGKRVGRLERKYAEGVTAGRKKFCTAQGIDKTGYVDGRDGRHPRDLLALYAGCPTSQLKRLSEAYKPAYLRGLTLFCDPANLETVALENASRGNGASEPASLSACFAHLSKTRSTYAEFFGEQRQHVVETQCTYDEGLERGSAAARAGARKATGMPDFCDPNLFGVYLNGYLEGWKSSRAKLCAPSEKTEGGEGERPEVCAEDADV